MDSRCQKFSDEDILGWNRGLLQLSFRKGLPPKQMQPSIIRRNEIMRSQTVYNEEIIDVIASWQTGMISTLEDKFYIQPLPSHLIKSNILKDSHPHVIYRRSNEEEVSPDFHSSGMLSKFRIGSILASEFLVSPVYSRSPSLISQTGGIFERDWKCDSLGSDNTVSLPSSTSHPLPPSLPSTYPPPPPPPTKPG